MTDAESSETSRSAPAETAEPPEVPAAPAPVFRVMDVLAVELDLPDQYPMLRLQETESPLRELALRIGLPEGVALAHALRRIGTPRPLTHELFTSVLQRLGVDVVAVRLVGRQGSTYLAEVDLMASRGREVLACRPTDGIALALRQVVPAPVLADERLLSSDEDVAPGA